MKKIKALLIISSFILCYAPKFVEAKRNTFCERQLKKGLQWNKKGSKSWQPNYIRELCDNSEGLAAINCFKSNWNKPGKDWASAIQQCKGKTFSKRPPKRTVLGRKSSLAKNRKYTIDFIGAQIGPCKDEFKPWDGISSKGCNNMNRITQGATAAAALGYAVPGVGQVVAALAVTNSLINKEPDVYGYAKVNGRQVTLVAKSSPIRKFDVEPSSPSKLGQIGPGQYIKFYFFDKDLANDDPMNSFTVSYEDLKPGYNVLYVAQQTAGQVVDLELRVR